MVDGMTMADSSIFWLRLAALLYAIGLLHSLLAILRRAHGFYEFALGAFRVGVVLHGVAIIELAMAEGRLPVENFYGTINLCAFLIALAFLFVDVLATGRMRVETQSVQSALLHSGN